MNQSLFVKQYSSEPINIFQVYKRVITTLEIFLIVDYVTELVLDFHILNIFCFLMEHKN
jgi:hypothetical protein